MSATKRFLAEFCVLSVILCTTPAWSVELGLDAGFSVTPQLDDWGASSHVQLLFGNGYGADMGYQYLNSISYSALGTTLTHKMSQYEASLLWQRGDEGFRFQALAGGVWSNRLVQYDGQDVVTEYAPGYQLNAGLSVPLFSRVRAFGELGYEGWFKAEIPNHLKWRYGIRLVLGRQAVQLRDSEKAQNEADQSRTSAALGEPNVSINPLVPEYMPSHLSQSLPPIVSNAEICKCYPAGPYTLQLGEFGNMKAAIRALDFRGLRQFFNSRSYLMHPLPVFLAQSEVPGPVGVYLGELGSVEQMQYWRRELRKSGIQARFRKVVGGTGERVANPIVAVDESELGLTPKYTEEEIRRMNSLPEELGPKTVMTDTNLGIQLADKEAYDEQVAQQRIELNTIEPAPEMLDTVLQSGPIAMTDLVAVLSKTDMQRALSRDPTMNAPAHMQMTWDEGNKEAWVSFSQFSSLQQVDEWQAWLDAEQLTARVVKQPYVPLGDTYTFMLGQPLQEFSVEVDRAATATQIMLSMRSPEVLWFQAYQRINDHPVDMTLNWSKTDKRYHLIVSNIANASDQQQVWTNLTSVGLLPSLAEE